MLADACAAWRACDHGHGVCGHKLNGLSNALDDSEGNLLSASRDAGRLWSELNMYDVRKAAMDEVDKMLDAGEITTFEDWQKVVVHPADPGVRGFEGDGTELEGTEDIIACVWLGDDERAAILRDDADALLEDVAKGKLPLEVQEPLRLEISAAKRLARLRELRAASVDLKVPASVKLLDDEIRQVSRGLHAGGSSERQESSRVVRALMDAVVEKERLAIKKRQRQAHKFKRVAVLQKAMERRAKKRVKTKAKAKAALKKKLDALPVVYNIENCGAPGGHGEKRSRECLERMKLRAPKLCVEHEAIWQDVKRAWCTSSSIRKVAHLSSKANVGKAFLDIVNDVLKKMGKYYVGPTEYNAKDPSKGDTTAFETFFLRMRKETEKPRAATMVQM